MAVRFRSDRLRRLKNKGIVEFLPQIAADVGVYRLAVDEHCQARSPPGYGEARALQEAGGSLSILLALAAMVFLILLISGSAFGGPRAQLGIPAATVIVVGIVLAWAAHELTDGMIWTVLLGAAIAGFVFWSFRNSK